MEQKRGSKTARMTKLWQFSQGHPKPVFSEKVQTEDQGKFLKKSPKKKPLSEKPTNTLAPKALFSSYYVLLEESLEKILAQKAAPKVPEWPGDGNVCKVTQKRHFLIKCKGGTKRNFSKIAQKVALV